jgi:hypothetical protein
MTDKQCPKEQPKEPRNPKVAALKDIDPESLKTLKK